MLETASAVIGVVGGVAGIWAFYWTQRDRERRESAMTRLAGWLAEDHTREDGWFPVNLHDERDREAALLGVENGILAFWARGPGVFHVRARLLPSDNPEQR